MIGRAQLDLDLPAPERPQPDFPALARAELTAALEKARAARDAPPWDYRQQRYWRVVGYQMAGWLPADEAVTFTVEFVAELDRIEPLFAEQVF